MLTYRCYVQWQKSETECESTAERNKLMGFRIFHSAV